MTLIIAAAMVFCVALRFCYPNPVTRSMSAVALLAGVICLVGFHPGGKAWTKANMGATSALEFPWPPQVGEAYPDLKLVDQDGNLTALSEFRGKVILIEPVGTPCRACVALAGGRQYGAFDGVKPQEDLESIETYTARYGGIELDDPRVVFVQLLLFNNDLQAPTPAEGRAWAKHFNMQRPKNQVVLVGDSTLVRPASRQMIPGFQLIDKNFILRADSTGHTPRDNLYTKLLPMIKQLADER